MIFDKDSKLIKYMLETVEVYSNSNSCSTLSSNIQDGPNSVLQMHTYL